MGPQADWTVSKADLRAREPSAEREGDMLGTPQQVQDDADVDEDVFGHGGDLGAAAYFDRD